MCRAVEQKKLKFTLVLITSIVSSKGFDWAFSSGDSFHKFLISLSSLAPQSNILNTRFLSMSLSHFL